MDTAGAGVAAAGAGVAAAGAGVVAGSSFAGAAVAPQGISQTLGEASMERGGTLHTATLHKSLRDCTTTPQRGLSSPVGLPDRN